MNRKSAILFLLSCLYGIITLGQNIEFVENKGQWDDRVRYMGQVSNGAFFIHNDGFTVLQHDSKDWEKLHLATHDHSLNAESLKGQGFIVHSHAYRVNFLDANAKAQLIADKPLNSYNNYFIGGDPSKWAGDCRIYQGVTLKDVYPFVDIRYYSDQGSMKYDLIVRPGGRVSDIAMKYDGADKIQVKARELVIGTSVGELKELEPYTYQYSEKGKTSVAAKYNVKDNVVRFDIKNYDPNSTLIIDPTLVFCSFTGSPADNWGFTATYGPDGSMYGGGIVFDSGFPVSTGAFQTNFGGGAGGCFGGRNDIGIIKLSPDGSNRMFATYLGGGGSEMPHSLIVDDNGELIVAGRTTSAMTGPGAYPVTAPMIQSAGAALANARSDYDIVITKLSANGDRLIGSRRIGGSGEDGANITPCGGSGANSLQRNYGDEARSEVNLDAAGNIYLAGCTQSDNFPIVGGFQATKAGAQDAVVIKFNPDLSNLLFSTFLGGTGNDAAYVLSISPLTGQIYVAGGTESTNLPGSTAGTLGAINNGAIDGFVSIISADGSSILKTTYVGTGANDQIYGIQFDRFGFPYVMGQTTGTWPIVNAAWSQPKGKQFIAKLQKDLSAYVYSTVFGKGEASPDISPVAFLVDRCENVYVSGWGGKVVSSLNYPTAGVSGLPVTPDALKSTPDINNQSGLGEDFYFFVLKKDASAQLYGSFFGQNSSTIGDHVDGGTSRFDKNGVIYEAICASCSNNSPFPTTPGAWATSKPPSANCNLALVKIAFNLAGVGSGVESFIQGVPRDTAGCVPLTVDFKDTALVAKSYEWNFGDGSPQITTTIPNATHTYTFTGTFKVMLVAIDSSTCNIRDTSYTHIRVGASRATLDFTPRKQGPCQQFQYLFENNSQAPIGVPFGLSSFTWDFGDGTPRVNAGPGNVNHTFASAGTYNVKLILHDTSYCNSPDSIVKQLRVAALVKAGFQTPVNGCAPYNAVFANTSQAGENFVWDFGDGGTSTQISPIHLYAVPGTYTIKLVATDTATCNKIDSTSFTITVYGKPTADFTADPQPPTVNTSISFTNLSSTDAVRFKWLFGDGDTLVVTNRAIVQHEYNATNTYNACLIAINPAGCADTACKQVRTLIEPAVDVPTAFTPGNGGVNSVVYVRGFGIAKMTFTIWARWGQKVFETNDKHIGWNGRFNGKLLPMDVYAYTLSVEFTDGTKTTKTGDITLIR
ncbi:MAG: PKD domain-containing protein [Flavisolibacter sp.]